MPFRPLSTECAFKTSSIDTHQTLTHTSFLGTLIVAVVVGTTKGKPATIHLFLQRTDI
jgi:hypothetical protein